MVTFVKRKQNAKAECRNYNIELTTFNINTDNEIRKFKTRSSCNPKSRRPK